MSKSSIGRAREERNVATPATVNDYVRYCCRMVWNYDPFEPEVGNAARMLISWSKFDPDPDEQTEMHHALGLRKFYGKTYKR